jgi:hypothetical protein
MSNSEIIERSFTQAVEGIKEDWFSRPNTKWYDYIVRLPLHLQTAYLVIVLHNQVFNGGFHQYFVNGYGQFAKETIDALINIKSFTKADLLKKALACVNVESFDDSTFREKLLTRDLSSLFIGDDLFDPLGKLDEQYYANDAEDIEQLLGAYLKNQ